MTLDTAHVPLAALLAVLVIAVIVVQVWYYEFRVQPFPTLLLAFSAASNIVVALRFVSETSPVWTIRGFALAWIVMAVVQYIRLSSLLLGFSPRKHPLWALCGASALCGAALFFWTWVILSTRGLP